MLVADERTARWNLLKYGLAHKALAHGPMGGSYYGILSDCRTKRIASHGFNRSDPVGGTASRGSAWCTAGSTGDSGNVVQQILLVALVRSSTPLGYPIAYYVTRPTCSRRTTHQSGPAVDVDVSSRTNRVMAPVSLVARQLARPVHM